MAQKRRMLDKQGHTHQTHAHAHAPGQPQASTRAHTRTNKHVTLVAISRHLLRERASVLRYTTLPILFAAVNMSDVLRTSFRHG